MENIQIAGKHGVNFIPTVNFNADTGICEIEGESYLEDTIEFYSPLFKWLKEYCVEINKPITFNFRLRYFNTSSSKCIIDILNILKKYKDDGGTAEVYWYYDAEEEDIEDELEEIEDFVIETNMKINLVPE
ncbi:MAG: hypothetical protein B6I20_10645 [Bacteroidetes bacterium 4572_117]|nr:MAG: hypothetical protein B6I20_10645 [Bacteroidetes bacterium 4572_117]